MLTCNIDLSPKSIFSLLAPQPHTQLINTQTKPDMKANNYEVAEAGETITFRGLVARSTSQAFFLTFCTALGMASLALVLQIQFQDLGKCERKEVLLLCCVLYDIWFIMTTCQCPQKSSSKLNQKNHSPSRYWLSQLVLPMPPITICGYILLEVRGPCR